MEKFLSFAPLPQIDFFTQSITKQTTINSENYKGHLVNFRYEVSNTIIHNERIIYGFLDWVGDVGGLIDGLRLICEFVLSFYVPSFASFFMVKNVFQIHQKDSLQKKPITISFW